jgi:DNA-binding transcriptional regulator GbsR (MarR family)
MAPMTDPDIEFSQFGGQLAETFSFNKSIGQIYALLYITQQPLALEDIANRLSMSKGNASINLRILEGWGAVRPVMVAGTRRDHYEANTNLKEIAMRRIQEGLGRRLELTSATMDRLLANSSNSAQKKKLQELRALLSKAEKAVGLVPKLLKVLDW